MLAAGGYWRPLAAVARLLEELGELDELGDGAGADLAGELADLWIITTALADQFLAAVAEPGAAGDSGATGSAGELLVAAGLLARVVNHYDGPKVPRAGAQMPSLHGAVADFQAALAALAAARGVNLAPAVEAKLDEIHRRGDIERFGRDGFDPSTAAVLGHLPAPSGSLPARLWGAPDASGGSSPQERAAALLPSLEMFAKAARAESLEGYVIEGPVPAGEAGRAAWLGALIAAIDPSGSAERFELAGTVLGAELLPAAHGARTLVLVRAERS